MIIAILIISIINLIFTWVITIVLAKLYNLFIEIKEEKAEPITLESAIDYLNDIDWLPEHDRIITESARRKSAERKGEWKWMGEQGDARFMCSVCYCKENVPTCNGEPTIWEYCPNCGARMVEGEKDERTN